MPDEKVPKDDEIDTFSRGDGEGRPGPAAAADPAALTSGEEDGYQADTFSRNDDEALPGVPEDAKP